MMKVNDFIEKAKLAVDSKTLYIKGCFGAPMNAKNKKRYSNNTEYNKKRADLIDACTSDTFGFDCVCLIKGILWGWNADKNKTYGGASYESNDVPDFGTEGMLNYCKDVSTDFTKIEKGEVLWLKGHAGIYIGNGLAIECTPKWANDVQITAVKNIGTLKGYNSRKWTKHGKLKFIDYTEEYKIQLPSRGYFQKGDRGDDIDLIDNWLYERYHDKNVLGKIFGKNTEKYVKKFQTQAKKQGIYTGKNATIDGKIGRLTLKAMRESGFKY